VVEIYVCTRRYTTSNGKWLGYSNGARADNPDLEHELIHVRQAEKEPFIFPILYSLETKNRANKYEVEAYRDSGSRYEGGDLPS
jgi:hypothetical protein